MSVQTVQRVQDGEIVSAGDGGPVLEYGLPRRKVRGGDVLACGFGMTVAAWITAYISRMPGVAAHAEVTVWMMVAMIFVGGVAAGRYSEKGVIGALFAGAVSGVLNILILGSLISDASRGAVGAANILLMVAGSVVLNTVVAGAGGLIGAALPSRRRGDIAWTQIFAVVLTVATLPLILAGGLVTALKAGMAVPDWPTSFGQNMFLFPLSQMQANPKDGIFYEHAHRLMGSLVGLTALTVAIYTTVADGRRGVKILAWTIFGAVCVQGIFGGTRVMENSVPLAMIHGIFAQMVFATMAVLAATSGADAKRHTMPKGVASTDRLFTMALVASLVIQLAFGALVRHTNSLVLLHISMAAIVTGLVLACGFRAWGLYSDVPAIRRTGVMLLLLVIVQLTLGVVAFTFRPSTGDSQTMAAAVLTTLHQANGAVLLATAAVLCVKMWGVKSLEVTPPSAAV